MEKVTGFLGDHWLSLTLLAVLVAAFLLLRSSPTELDGAAELDAILINGEPAIVEFYSNY